MVAPHTIPYLHLLGHGQACLGGYQLLYGVAHLLGWAFDVEGAPTALGTSSIPPATTMFFELHFHSEEDEDEVGYFVARGPSLGYPSCDHPVIRDALPLRRGRG